MQLLKHKASSLQSKMQSSKAVPHRSTQTSFNSCTLKDQRYVYLPESTFLALTDSHKTDLDQGIQSAGYEPGSGRRQSEAKLKTQTCLS